MQIDFFSESCFHLKLRIAVAEHNFKYVKNKLHNLQIKCYNISKTTLRSSRYSMFISII